MYWRDGMRDFLVRCKYTSAVDLANPHEIKLPDGVRVHIQPNNEIDPGGVVLECGFNAEVFLPAANIEEACRLAPSMADQVASLFSLVSAAAISLPEVESAIDVTPGTADREV